MAMIAMGGDTRKFAHDQAAVAVMNMVVRRARDLNDPMINRIIHEYRPGKPVVFQPDE
jgi:hypothetical protein